ncbi:hypothetical protein B1R94_22145 [Mycolicibacterium litorale]|nr:hypothetical protein B1R94_22145 [Mycolicibacterium litorale]
MPLFDYATGFIDQHGLVLQSREIKAGGQVFESYGLPEDEDYEAQMPELLDVHEYLAALGGAR